MIILFFMLWLQISTGEEFDPTKFNYCSKECNPYSNFKHTACNCGTIEEPREVILDDFMHFRTRMVELHNAYRNNLAKGGEENRNFPKAANMHVINYDLELEFIANCYAKRIFDSHDKCRMKHDMDMNAGQNIFGFGAKVEPQDYDSFFNNSVSCWYDEVQNVTDTSIVDKFRKDGPVKNGPKAHIGHFTQVVWASVRAIGCARVFIDKNEKRSTWRSILFCNYAGRTKDGYSGNVKSKPIYLKGEPCSQCPDGEKCNKEYGGKWDSLCGESEAIPTRAPFGFEGGFSSEAESMMPTNQVLSTISGVIKPSIRVLHTSGSTIADVSRGSTKTPDSSTPNSNVNRAHQIFVDHIFIVGIVILSCIKP